MMAVISKPINRPIKGLEVANNIDSAVLFPSLVNDAPTMSIANKNNSSDNKIVIV